VIRERNKSINTVYLSPRCISHTHGYLFFVALQLPRLAGEGCLLRFCRLCCSACLRLHRPVRGHPTTRGCGRCAGFLRVMATRIPLPGRCVFNDFSGTCFNGLLEVIATPR
jgi:hypothetical protein